jgi:hypothetical protein
LHAIRFTRLHETKLCLGLRACRQVSCRRFHVAPLNVAAVPPPAAHPCHNHVPPSSCLQPPASLARCSSRNHGPRHGLEVQKLELACSLVSSRPARPAANAASDSARGAARAVTDNLTSISFPTVRSAAGAVSRSALRSRTRFVLPGTNRDTNWS